MSVKREGERVQIMLMLWLSEKAILVWARLMEEMVKVLRDHGHSAE